jgi:hypothetical protein
MGIEEDAPTHQSLPYQEYKNKRPVRRVGLTGRVKMKEPIKEMGKTLTTEESTKPSLGIEISTEAGDSNRQWGALGTKSRTWKEKKRSEKLFWRERVKGRF